MMKPIIVVKVGGSLMDWPELGPRLNQWLPTLLPGQLLLVPGGGPTADVVRVLDQHHSLGEEKSHWLALRALTLNAHFLATILNSQKATVVANFQEAKSAWSRNEMPILDLFPFALGDESIPGRLPHLWSATSDSLAARLAARIEAQKLVLLKSASIPAAPNWSDPGLGLVDPYFAKVVDEPGSRHLRLEVSAINFREWRG